jgi:putative ABC transport system substrate-binding protein
MAYGPDLGELAQRIASDVHHILSGTKAGDLPFYLKAAKALLHEVPQALLARADEVIE